MSNIPIDKVRQKLPGLIHNINRRSKPIIIFKQRKKIAVILSFDQYDSLIETLDIMSDPNLVRQIREGLADIKNNKFHTAGSRRTEAASRPKTKKIFRQAK